MAKALDFCNFALEMGHPRLKLPESETGPIPARGLQPFRHITVLGVISAVLVAAYTYLFWNSLSSYWFDPRITTDDALQQIYPFHVVYNPGLFDGDLITKVMVGYLAPLHYWICYSVTYLTESPIMMGHWVMLIQFSLTVIFTFLGVRFAAGTVPALFSVAWFMHTRNIVQRLTGGLPRGWSAPILTGFLYFALRGNHKAVLLVLLAGCLLNPPSTIIAALAYGLILIYRSFKKETRAIYSKRLLQYVLLAPVYLGVVFYVVQRPEGVGEMVTLEKASSMPEFDRYGGRFAFLPFRPIWEEINTTGMQAFVARWYNPGPLLKENIGLFVVAALLLVLWAGVRRKREVIPIELLIYLVSILSVYIASRELAFLLYVPDRHVQFPLGFFFIFAFPIGLWRLFHRGLDNHSSELRKAFGSAVALAALGIFIYLGSDDGLKGPANFNWFSQKRGDVFTWLRNNSPKDAVIAGHPTHIDGVQLFGMRKAYATTETTHPFYLDYLAEMERRLEITWRAYYAKDLSVLVELLEPEGVDYFVYKRGDFYAESLKTASYFKPLNALVQELANRNPEDYAFNKLPPSLDPEHFPYMVFKDGQSVIIDIAKLKTYLSQTLG